MSDMSSTIIPKSDQINADNLLTGPKTIKITKVEIRPGQEQPVSIFYEGDEGKPYKCCKSMARVIVNAWGADSTKYVGRSMTIYRDPTVKWAGMEVGGIRISHMSDIDKTLTMALTATRQSRKPYTVKPLVSGKESAPAAATSASSDLSPAEPGEGGGDGPNDAALIKDIEGWVKKKSFDTAFDLARGLSDATRAATVERITKAQEYVLAKGGAA